MRVWVLLMWGLLVGVVLGRVQLVTDGCVLDEGVRAMK